MKNSFVKQFDQNIKFNYSCFDRVILRGYIIRLFFAGGIAALLRTLGLKSLSNGIMRILTDQLNSHIEKIANARNIPIHWWPSIDGLPLMGELMVQNKNMSRKSMPAPTRERTIISIAF